MDGSRRAGRSVPSSAASAPDVSSPAGGPVASCYPSWRTEGRSCEGENG